MQDQSKGRKRNSERVARDDQKIIGAWTLKFALNACE
jgi:hypothetical protein